MPGFNICGQGQGPNSLAEVRRTHRWTFASTTYLNRNVLVYLKTATRPSMSFDEPEMHHNQEKVYYAGKHTWEPLNLTWYDAEQDPDVSENMWEWLNVCLDVTQANVNPPNVYKATETNLAMLNGLGAPTESWTVCNGWPKLINWSNLDYTSSELQTIEVQFRFDRAVRN